MAPVDPFDPAARALGGSWWRGRPRVGVVAAMVAFAAVVAVQSVDPGGPDGVAVLVVIPVAVLGLLFGRRVGVLAGAAGVAFGAVWSVADGGSLGAAGWTAVAVPPLAVGILAGRVGAAEAAAARWRRLAAEAHRGRQRSTERTETVVQSLVAAKWSFEAGRTDEGLSVLTDAIAAAERLVVDLVRAPAPGSDRAERPAAGAALDLTDRVAPPVPPSGPFVPRP